MVANYTDSREMEDSNHSFSPFLIRAEEALCAAKLLREKGFSFSAIRNLFYACLFSATATVINAGLKPHNHRAVISLFYREVLNKGSLDSKWGKLLQSAYRHNKTIDMNLTCIPDEAGILELEKQANDMLSEIKNWLSGKQLEEST